MKLILTWIAVGAFAALGVCGLVEGNLKVGIATICLAVANGLLLLL